MAIVEGNTDEVSFVSQFSGPSFRIIIVGLFDQNECQTKRSGVEKWGQMRLFGEKSHLTPLFDPKDAFRSAFLGG